MKKFLVLAMLLSSANVYAGLPKFYTKAINCTTITDFTAAQTAGNAGPNTDCRRSFCEHVCVACPGASGPRALCQKNCVGILLKGPEAEVRTIHDELSRCHYLGRAASYNAVIESHFGDPETQALSKNIPDAVKDYEGAIQKLERSIADVNKAQPAVTKARDQIIAEARKAYPHDPNQGTAVAERLIELLNAKAQKAEGTFTPKVRSAYEDSYGAYEQPTYRRRRSYS